MKALLAAALCAVVTGVGTADAMQLMQDDSQRPTRAALVAKVAKLEKANRALRVQLRRTQRARRTTASALETAEVTLETLNGKLDQLLDLKRADEVTITNLTVERDAAKGERDAAKAETQAVRDELATSRAETLAARDETVAVQAQLIRCQEDVAGAVATMTPAFIWTNVLPPVFQVFSAADNPNGDQYLGQINNGSYHDGTRWRSTTTYVLTWDR